MGSVHQPVPEPTLVFRQPHLSRLPVQLNVLLFASYAEALGAPSVTLTLGEGASVADVLAAIRALAPGRGLPPALVAVNQDYASLEHLVAQGDEVAIIPPVAGG